MLLLDAPLTFGELTAHEEAPLSAVFHEILVFGAQAVNAYCDPPRMTADVDILSSRARELAEELRARLSELSAMDPWTRSSSPKT